MFLPVKHIIITTEYRLTLKINRNILIKEESTGIVLRINFLH